MILLPFIENGFKHGTRNETGTIPINIEIDIQNNVLTFKVENLSTGFENSAKPETSEWTGIGINNAKRTLNLLFKNDYFLDIQNSKSNHNITLKMPLDDKMPNS